MHLQQPADEDFCDYCKNIFFPPKDDEGVSVLQDASDDIARSARPLMHAALAKVQIRYCTRCRGMLVPMGVFLALVKELRAGEPGSLVPPPPDTNELQRKIDCPHCHNGWTRIFNGPGNVVIEDCERAT